DDKEITWTSSDEDVAKIDSHGTITTNKEGTATITAKLGEFTKTCTLTVKKQVVTCSVGEYLPKTKDTCEKCLEGYECSGGSYPISNITDQGMKICTAGTYSEDKGTVSCTSCPKGTYSNKEGAKTCETCPSGKTTENEGSTSCTSDVVTTPTCLYSFNSEEDAGTYGKTYCENKYGSSIQVKVLKDDCEKFGFDCTTETKENYKCYLCGSEYSWKLEGNYTGCFVTPSILNPNTGLEPPSEGNCKGSPESKSIQYCENHGMYYKECPSNYTKIGTAGDYGCVTCKAKSVNNTITCGAGYYHPANTNKDICNTKCPKGYYCKGGYFTKSTEEYGIEKCPNNYTSDSGKSKETECYIDVGAGRMVDKAGSLPVECPAGKYMLEHRVYYGDTSQCKLCRQGTYQNESGKASCKKCPVGTYNINFGSTSSASCNKCYSGTYSDETGLSVCKNCAPGTYQDERGKTSCKQCGKGMVSILDGSKECTKCKSGMSNSEHTRCIKTCTCKKKEKNKTIGTYLYGCTGDTCSCLQSNNGYTYEVIVKCSYDTK
ncbi:MAG: Ig-like domain-containing protein, partial [Bacilli bacterium]|nr:Ig-like domain-containing protein [Bacilli bacterium]